MSDLRKTYGGPLFRNVEGRKNSDGERMFLNAASSGDIAMVQAMFDDKDVDVNCVDFMGRSALLLAVENEHIDVIDFMMQKANYSNMKASLLHGISKGLISVVEFILEHPCYIAAEENLQRLGMLEDTFFRTDLDSGDHSFPSYITPLTLACHINNPDLIQMLLAKGHVIERPHHISCECNDCKAKSEFDSLKMSRSRLNAYRALVSPAYIVLCSTDPILATFELKTELKELAALEKEFKTEYQDLVDRCMDFACEMMDLCRSTQEVETLLSDGKDPIARLKLAVRNEEKKFVAHPNCQQYLTALFYGSELSFLKTTKWPLKLCYMLLVTPLVPLISITYILFPKSRVARYVRCPSTKFLLHTISHLVFLILLAQATFQTSEIFNEDINVNIDNVKWKSSFRGESSIMTPVQIVLMGWVLGLLWIEVKEIYRTPFCDYAKDYYNYIIFMSLSLYIGSYVLRILAMRWILAAKQEYSVPLRSAKLALEAGNGDEFHRIAAQIKEAGTRESYFMEASRFHWKMDDPEIVADAMFSVANVLSFARTTYIMPAFEVLGPLQISLGRMVGDITRFLALYLLVLLAFTVGLNNLYWYYGQVKATDAFTDLMVTVQTLFWSTFGPSKSAPEVSKLSKPKGCTEGGEGGAGCQFYGNTTTDAMVESSTTLINFVGATLYSVFCVFAIIILVNMLIAMMSHSFEAIQEACDVEWKFARSKLWLSYIADGSNLSAPFNLLPTPSCAYQSCKYVKKTFMDGRRDSITLFRAQTVVRARRQAVCEKLHVDTVDTSYADIAHSLANRYLLKLGRQARPETKGCTEGGEGGAGCQFYGNTTTDAMVESSTTLINFVGATLYSVFCVFAIIILVNMLIAMMSHSFEAIQEACDVEWKFARSKLWLSYIADGSNLSAPFNLLPTPSCAYQSCKYVKKTFMDGRRDSITLFRAQTVVRARRQAVCEKLHVDTVDTSYADIAHSLANRYLLKLGRQARPETKGESHVILETSPPPSPSGTPTIFEGKEELNVADLKGGPTLPQFHLEHVDEEGEVLKPTICRPLFTPMLRRSNPEMMAEEQGRRSFSRKSKRSVRVHSPLTPTSSEGTSGRIEEMYRVVKLLDMRFQHLQENTSQIQNLVKDLAAVKADLEKTRSLLETQRRITVNTSGTPRSFETISTLNILPSFVAETEVRTKPLSPRLGYIKKSVKFKKQKSDQSGQN
ncbi:short transient receptor potential channel 3 [Lingula anatina]|uniref:Short transient receptor potential channel 3 n=1 Tax=Lingula anatina TaxID=7574 RepID=A0A1S3K4A2_LINAN|nr:short transient receptor potential channel 3 [Lingula anatina]|eukprot:XP_013417244.1 short transient receptor potential channel 3 [Lingula anatina]